jgi:Fe-S-cluster containining protein
MGRCSSLASSDNRGTTGRGRCDKEDVEQAAKKFSEKASGRKKRVIRHRNDEHFGSVCRFLNRKTRACSIYAVRPKICSDFPGTRRCGYYDFLTFERRLLKDSDHVAVTDHP